MSQLKFEDCKTCRFRREAEICAECDMGELYEAREVQGVDAYFRHGRDRFGDSVTSDEVSIGRNFDPSRFADSFEDDADGDCHDDD